jgi:hypothetical protein
MIIKKLEIWKKIRNWTMKKKLTLQKKKNNPQNYSKSLQKTRQRNSSKL